MLAKEPNGQASLNNVIGLVVVLLAVIMNEGAVDSLQNGIASVIASQWLKNRPLMWSRCVDVLFLLCCVVFFALGVLHVRGCCLPARTLPPPPPHTHT